MSDTPAHRPSGHPPIRNGRIGVLLVNLGTPEATDYWPMRRYLKEFLSDRRVIETNPILWWFILHGVILNIRPRRSGHAYEKIWNHSLNESPLKTITRSQSERLAAEFSGDVRIAVRWAMRYGLPPIAEELQALRDEGCDRILIFPLYPQYSAATTATVADKVFEVLRPMRWQPSIRIVPPYYEHPVYISALAASLETGLAALPWKPDRILASFHGLPQSYLDAGDPYYCQCHKTSRLLDQAMKFTGGLLSLVFQSRFGAAAWLKPYAQQTVEELPAQSVKNLVMIMPGFAADCIETLEEVGIGLRDTFLERGGENFAVIPCLNDSAGSVAMLASLARQELQGWI